MKKTTSSPKIPKPVLQNTKAPTPAHTPAEFWMPLKVGLFTGLLMAALTFPAWQLRRFFISPEDLLQIGILKTADVTLLVVIPVLTGIVLGYLLLRNNASLKQALVAVVLAGALQQIIMQIGETYTLVFFLIPVTATLVSTLVAKNALKGFQT